MKLGEALTLRKDLKTRIDEVTRQIQGAMVREEDETPSVNVAELRTQLEELIRQKYDLIAKINKTNSLTFVDGMSGETIADLITRRDYVKERKSSFQTLLQYAKPRQVRLQDGTVIRHISEIPPDDLRKQADDAAKAFRQIDVTLQGLNWTVDLL